MIGAGTMGSGIAQAFAQTEGYEVMLCDVKAEWAENGKAKIAKGLNKRVDKRQDGAGCCGCNPGKDHHWHE